MNRLLLFSKKTSLRLSRMSSFHPSNSSVSARFLSTGLNQTQLFASANLFVSYRRNMSSNASAANDNSADIYSVLNDAENLDDYYDRPRYPVVEQVPEYLSETRHLHQVPNNKIYQEVSFEKVFEKKSFVSVHDVQHGAYVNLDQATIDKYFPEGLAGETLKEFDHASRLSWMIRPVSKFLFRVIENFDKKEMANSLMGEKWRPAPKEVVPLVYKGVTDRGEWPESRTSIRYHSKEVVKAEQDAVVDGVLPGIKYVGSEIENWLDNVHKLSSARNQPFPNKILLAGPRGVGKSIALNQAVLHARSRGWLCFFIPSAWEHCQSGDYVTPVIFNADESPAVYDNPIMSVAALRSFHKAHAELLSTIPIRNPEEVFAKYSEEVAEFKNELERLLHIPGREKLPFLTLRSMIEGEDNNPTQDQLDSEFLSNFSLKDFSLKTLADLVIFGLAFRNFSGLVAMDLIAELKEVTSVPVMIAVDEWNQLEVKSAFAYEEKDVIGKEMCIPHALQFLSQKKSTSDAWNLKNGICIAALSFKHCEGKAHHITYEKEQRSVPLMIRVPVYDSREFVSAVSYYQAQKIVPKSATTQDMLAFRIMTGSNPWKIRKDTADYWLPIECGKMRGEIDHPNFFLGDEDNPYPNKWILDDDADFPRRDDRVRDIVDDVVKAGGGGESVKSRR